MKVDVKFQAFQALIILFEVCAQSLSQVRLFATLWTLAHQAPLSMGFSRKEHWSMLPCSPSENLPDPGIEPVSPASPALAGGFFTTEPPEKLKPHDPKPMIILDIINLFCWKDLLLIFTRLFLIKRNKIKFLTGKFCIKYPICVWESTYSISAFTSHVSIFSYEEIK